MAQIAAASGIKVGQIYRDFSSKEDIVAAIAAANLERFLNEDRLREAIAASDLDAICLWITDFIACDRDITDYRLMPEIMAESGRNVRVAGLLACIHQQVRVTLMEALEACAPGDRYGEARAGLADVVMTIGGGLAQFRVITGHDNPAPLASHLSEMVMRELDAMCISREEPQPV